MYRFNSAERLVTRFTSAYHRKQHFHPRSLPFTNSRVIPPELQRMVRLTCKSTAEGGICDVYLVGVRHFHPKSCEEVKAAVNFLKPQVANKPKVVSEFKVAFEEAKKNGAKVMLGDRSIKISKRRLEDKYYRKFVELPPWQPIKFFFSHIIPVCKRLYMGPIKFEEIDENLILIHEESCQDFQL